MNEFKTHGNNEATLRTQTTYNMVEVGPWNYFTLFIPSNATMNPNSAVTFVIYYGGSGRPQGETVTILEMSRTCAIEPMLQQMPPTNAQHL